MKTVGAATGILLAWALALPASGQQAPPEVAASAVQVNRDRVVVTGMVPAPDVGPGAPLYKAEDVARIEDAARTTVQKSTNDYHRCNNVHDGRQSARAYVNAGNTPFPTLPALLAVEVQAGDKVVAASSKAASLTKAAEDVRRAAAAGKADKKAVEAAELKRQDAVNKMDRARLELLEAQAMLADFQQATLSNHPPDWGELRLKAGQRRLANVGLGVATPGKPEGLSIGGVRAVEKADDKGGFVEVYGVIRNSGSRAADVPNLSGSLIDGRGWVVASMSVVPDRRETIPAGGEHPFGFVMRPAPGELQKAIVTFANPNVPPARLGIGVTCIIAPESH